MHPPNKNSGFQFETNAVPRDFFFKKLEQLNLQLEIIIMGSHFAPHVPFPGKINWQGWQAECAPRDHHQCQTCPTTCWQLTNWFCTWLCSIIPSWEFGWWSRLHSIYYVVLGWQVSPERHDCNKLLYCVTTFQISFIFVKRRCNHGIVMECKDNGGGGRLVPLARCLGELQGRHTTRSFLHAILRCVFAFHITNWLPEPIGSIPWWKKESAREGKWISSKTHAYWS